MLLMVADSGGGKSGIMLAMAEAVTACADAVVINLDPIGTGVGDLGPAITLNACMDDDKIVAVLVFLLALCSARARQRAAHGWGNKWQPSPTHPAICLFVDEWGQLSPEAKALLIRLLLLGRKEGIWVYGGSQFGTKDWLGEAIGPKLATKLLGACRRVDVTELLGAGALAEGYRSDLIRAATHTAVNDAGQIHGVGMPGLADRPVRYKFREITSQYALQVGTERAAAGLPDLTHTLTDAAMLDAWTALVQLCDDTRSSAAPEPPEILALLLEVFEKAGKPESLTVGNLLTLLADADPVEWARWESSDSTTRLREGGRKIALELKAAGLTVTSTRLTTPGRPSAYRLADLQHALASPDAP